MGREMSVDGFGHISHHQITIEQAVPIGRAIFQNMLEALRVIAREVGKIIILACCEIPPKEGP